jgi:hypothetical protein
LGNSSEANCLGERRKVVKVASLSTLEVSTEMNKGFQSSIMVDLEANYWGFS